MTVRPPPRSLEWSLKRVWSTKGGNLVATKTDTRRED